jgi:hypothetical protein
VLVLVVVLVLDVLGFYGKKEIPSAAKLKPVAKCPGGTVRS